MNISKLWKRAPLAALLLALYVPVTMAGGTNRGDNTSATPGENSSSTVTPTDPQSGAIDDVKKGTTTSKDVKGTKKGDRKGKSKSDSNSSTDSSGHTPPTPPENPAGY